MDTEAIKARLARLAPRFEQLADIKHKLRGQEALLEVVQGNVSNTKREMTDLQNMLTEDIRQITEEASGTSTLEGKRAAFELAHKTALATVSVARSGDLTGETK